MKVLSTETVFWGPIGGEKAVVIECSPEERLKLIEALKTIEAFKYKARKEIRFSEKDADWTMYSFNIKGNIVNVHIRCGACG